MKRRTTKEPQYQACLELIESRGVETFGLMSNFTWVNDPKRLLFVLARYKFVAKMLQGLGTVLEVGCADAFGSRLVSREVKSLTASDLDPLFIEDARSRPHDDNTEYLVHDFVAAPLPRAYDGAFALDVIEHIPPAQERAFVGNMKASLGPHGVMILGTPSIYSQAYSSAESKEGHVNCKDENALKGLLKEYFHNVFLFSMNDEVVHTGFAKMAHYYFALCCGPKT